MIGKLFSQTVFGAPASGRACLSLSCKVALAVMAAVLPACALNGNHSGFVQFYEGKPLPKEQVGLVKGHYSYRNGTRSNDMIRIVAIDDKDVPSQLGVAEGADTVAVLPGRHSFKILFVSGYAEVDFYSYRTLRIDVKPGCGYELSAHLVMPTAIVGFDVLPAPLSINSSQDCRIENDVPAKQDSWRS